jgi:asparagine synthase (glutamine-hydrolysing)
MCGIAGCFGERNEDVLTDMIDCIDHRGPDDSGTYFDDGFMMGMRRLSIVGVDSGHQPIHNEDETIWTVFNGEIYNYPEIKEELENKGHEFYTEADTEVLVHLYEEYGEEFVEKLNGMFAFAIWDEEKEKLLIYRDRIGIKPMYYAQIDGKFYFGSEIRSILQTGMEREPDLEGLSYYWHLRYIPAPFTAFEDIKKLEPGHYLSITDKGIEKNQYWELKGRPDDSKSEEYYVEKLRELLEDSVERRMMADVPLGAFLRGGID